MARSLQPGARAVALLLLSVGLAAVGVMGWSRDVHTCLQAAFWALNVAAVAGPLGALLARRFWPTAAVATALCAALFLTLPILGTTFARRQFGENAMVFLVPLTLFPAAMAVAGLLRLAWWAWRRRASATGAA